MSVMLNKKESTRDILGMAEGHVRCCEKQQMDNIVFPKWPDLGLFGMVFAQRVKTKEQPQGCDYAETVYQTVLRVVGGKVLGTSGMPDVYAWKQAKVDGTNPEKVRSIGLISEEGVENMNTLLMSVDDEGQRSLLADFFCKMRLDFKLITTDAENRLCVEVTQSLFDRGLTHCVDSWMEVDEKGFAPATELAVGDYLIVNPEAEKVYCIRRGEFLETHRLL